MLQYNIPNTTLWIVIGFLLVTLILGLYAGRGIKDIKDYALGGKTFSTFALTLTLLATVYGGRTIIGETGEIYSIGIIAAIAYLAKATLQHLTFAFIIAPKILKFRNCITVGDLIKQLYGEKIQVIASCLCFLVPLFSASVQIYAIGKICNVFFNIDPLYGIILGGTILGIYSTIGGIKAVTYTDMLQFIVLFTVIPFVATTLLKGIGGYKELLMNIPKEKLTIINNKKFYYYLTIFLSSALFPRRIMDTAIMQRVFMCTTKEQVRNKFLSSAIIDLVLKLVLIIIAFVAITSFQNLKSKEVFLYVMNNSNFLSGKIMKGFIISSLLAVIMSSADSYIHSGGLVLGRDILKFILKKSKYFNELFIVRMSTIIVSILTVIIAIEINNGFKLSDLSLLISLSIGPALLFPVFLGILGIKPDKKSLSISIIVGLISYILINMWLSSDMKVVAIPVSTFINGLAYMLAHIIQNKGIAWVQREEKDEGNKKTKLWIPEPTKILKKLLSYIPTPKNIYNYSRFQVMKHGSENIIFGIYCCVNFTLPYVLWDSNDPERYNLMTNLRFIGGIMAGLLIVKDEWKKFLKPYYPLYWHATLTYCLPFITTVMFLLSKGSLLWLIQIAVSIFMLVMLVAGEVFLILAPLGIMLGLVFYSYFIGPIDILGLGFDTNYYLIYVIMFPTIISLLFAYKKRIFNKETSNIGINLGLSLCHEIRNTLSALSYSDMAKRTMDRIKETSKVKSIDGKEILMIENNSFNTVYDYVDTSLGLNRDSVTAFENLFIEYKKSKISLQVDSVEETVHNTLTDLYFLPGQLEKIEVDLRDDFFIQLPRVQFAFVLSNIIRNAFKHGNPSKVEIRSENNKLIIKDNGKGIPEENLETIFKMHYTTGKKGDSSGIGLWFSKIIINTFNGEIWCNSEQGENSYTEFTIKFPDLDPSKITEEDRKRINEKKTKRLRKLEKEEIAKRMLEKEDPIEKIEERTSLSSSEIKEIQKKIRK